MTNSELVAGVVRNGVPDLADSVVDEETVEGSLSDGCESRVVAGTEDDGIVLDVVRQSDFVSESVVVVKTPRGFE